MSFWLIYFIFFKQLKDLNEQQILEDAEYEAMKKEALRLAEEKAFKDKVIFWCVVIGLIAIILFVFKMIYAVVNKSEEKTLQKKETEENKNI